MSALPSTKPELWTPDLFGRQWDVFNCYKRILLVSGSRISGKSRAALHRIARHLWETPRARVGFFAKSIKSAKDSGLWQDFIELIVPEWTNSGIGFEVTTIDASGEPGAKQDAQTRTAFIKVRNIYGGESEMRLFSVDHDHQVATKVKGKSFSMIFFSELSMFKDRRILSQSLPSLRMDHLLPKPGQPDLRHQWLADTNPDEEIGDRSWFYELWYKERLRKTHPNPRFQQSLHLIEMFYQDNPYITPDQISDLEGSCHGDPALYDANVRGIHGDGGKQRKRLFASMFDRSKHVVGGKEGEGDQIDVRDSTTILYGGWDLGTSTNHGAGILEKWYKMIDGRARVCWSILDELVLLHEAISLAEFTQSYLEKQKSIRAKYPQRKFEWQHWSDNTAVNVFRASSGSYDYMEISAASKGEIILNGVEKPQNSIHSRIRLLRMYLQQERIFISSRCENVIRMLEWARKGDDDDEPFLRDEHKHTFDWLTYPMYMEALDDLVEESYERPESTPMESASVS